MKHVLATTDGLRIVETADWHCPVCCAKRHLPGKHDQSTHGKGGGTAPSMSAAQMGFTVDSLPRKAGSPGSPGNVAKDTNPHFGATGVEGAPTYRDAGRAGDKWDPDMGPPPSGAYEENCTNTTDAFEMRMRGYEVQAAPLDVLDKYGYAAGRTHKEIEDQLADSWTLPGGKPHGRTLSGQKWRSFNELDTEIAQTWPEGGRGKIFTGRHVFSVVKIHGKAQYIEPQYDANPSRNVTSLYKKKFKGSGIFGTVEEGKLVRLDDLEPAAGILNAVAVP